LTLRKFVFLFLFLILVSNLLKTPEAMSQNGLEGVHIKVTFIEPVNMTIVERIQNLLPFLDQAYEYLSEWTQFAPYNRDKIEIKFDKSFFNDKPENIIGWSGNPIHIKVYPSGDLSEDLYIFFHELTHDFTPPNLWRVWGDVPSLTEGLADLGAIFLYSRLSGNVVEYGEFLHRWISSILRNYEDNRNPFAEVKWSEAHPDNEYPSDRLAAGILLAVADGYGLEIFRQFFSLASQEKGQSIFGSMVPSTFAAKMNFLAYLLSLTTSSDLTKLFKFWGFPLNQDSDSDGLSDEQEIGAGLSISDFDRDEVNDNHELELGTNPHRPDTDNDGLNDGIELQVGSDPLKQDTDEDGILDYEEVMVYETSPIDGDTDHDWWSDASEVSIMLWINETIPFLFSMARSIPRNWWLPNVPIAVALLLVFLVIIIKISKDK